MLAAPLWARIVAARLIGLALEGSSEVLAPPAESKWSFIVDYSTEVRMRGLFNLEGCAESDEGRDE